MKSKETDKDLFLEKELLKKVDGIQKLYHGIVLAQRIPDLISAWQLSQALSMDAHFIKHEQNALGIIVKVDLRLVNPTGETFKVRYPVVRFLYNGRFYRCSPKVDKSFTLERSVDFDTLYASLSLKQFPTGLWKDCLQGKPVNFTFEIMIVIDDHVPVLRKFTVSL